MNNIINSLELTGVVISVSDRTAKVQVTQKKLHHLYRKRYTVDKSYLADVAKDQVVEVGQQVIIERTRPLSKRKFWKIKK